MEMGTRLLNYMAEFCSCFEMEFDENLQAYCLLHYNNIRPHLARLTRARIAGLASSDSLDVSMIHSKSILAATISRVNIVLNDNRMDVDHTHIVSAMFLNQVTLSTTQNPETSREADHIHGNLASGVPSC